MSRKICAIATILLLVSHGSWAAGELSHPVVPGAASDRGLSPNLQGLLLLGELNCTSCHDPGQALGDIHPKPAPQLADTAARIHHEHILEFITDPLRTNPGTTMPDTLGLLCWSESTGLANQQLP